MKYNQLGTSGQLPRGIVGASARPPEVFDEWFLRCLGPLHFIACRVLGDSERANVAVLKCWLTASRNPTTFDREGEFRSWLLRVLIDKALAILHDARGSGVGNEQPCPPSFKNTTEPHDNIRFTRAPFVLAPGETWTTTIEYPLRE
jgi:DNA-directed RNA polymerase specialized sigma24 family protein